MHQLLNLAGCVTEGPKTFEIPFISKWLFYSPQNRQENRNFISIQRHLITLNMKFMILNKKYIIHISHVDTHVNILCTFLEGLYIPLKTEFQILSQFFVTRFLIVSESVLCFKKL